MWSHKEEEYARLEQEPGEPLLARNDGDSDDEALSHLIAPRNTTRSSKTLQILAVALMISIMANFAVVWKLLALDSSAQPKISEFAGLQFDQDIPWTHYTPYASKNLTEAGELWNNIDWDSGFIALDSTYAEAHGLPQSQPFPWDQSKGIYLINAYHNLHCLKSIHQYIRELSLGTPLSFHMEHIGHCLDSLRLDTICAADDTPRFTPSSIEHFTESGVGQPRKCRDFSKLEAWAQEHHSCYSRIDELHQCENQMERYKFCPEDSPYQDIMHEYFRVVLDQELPPVVPKEAGTPGRCNVTAYVEELRATQGGSH